MFVPVTKEDFVRIGRRYSSEEIIGEMDRLLPLAGADIQTLSAGGYTQPMLAELTSFRDRLRTLRASSRQTRGAKRGARQTESLALQSGLVTLRQGIAMATVALARRPAPEGESTQTTREKITGLTARIQSLAAAPSRTSAALRTRLENLKSLLGLPDFAPVQGEENERNAYLNGLDKVLATLTAHAETKKSLKEASKDQTVIVDETDGRAYSNMKLLTQVGRAAFMAAGDKVHAAMYSLRNLNRKMPGQALDPTAPAPQPSAPAQPLPAQPAARPQATT